MQGGGLAWLRQKLEASGSRSAADGESWSCRGVAGFAAGAWWSANNPRRPRRLTGVEIEGGTFGQDPVYIGVPAMLFA